MNRNTILLFFSAAVLLVVVIGLAIFLSFKNSNKDTTSKIQGGVYGNSQTVTTNKVTTTAKSTTIGAITVYAPVGGWQLAQNNDLKVSLKVPENWDISADVSKYNFKAAWNTDRVGMSADIYSYDNPNKITPAQWAVNNNLKDFTSITIGGISGVRYVTKVTYGKIFNETPTPIENSYFVGLILPQGGKIIDASCFVNGVDYSLYKSNCDEVINAFSFIK
jgi:hypothetical protein